MLYCQYEGIVKGSRYSTISNSHNSLVVPSPGSSLGGSRDFNMRFLENFQFIETSTPRFVSKSDTETADNSRIIVQSSTRITYSVNVAVDRYQRPALHEKTRTDSVFIVSKKLSFYSNVCSEEFIYLSLIRFQFLNVRPSYPVLLYQ